jgi:crotonobetainyl-CoA:carnitine CoA-transferase CaiB-like acyl-CoA transferase
MKTLNPKLIWASISGFGRLEGFRGPYSDRPAFDIVAEAMSGVMHQVGFADKPPSWTIYGMADIYTGLVTAWGVMQALFMRTRTGQGQFVDSSMLDNMIALNESMIVLHSVAGQSPERGKPKNIYPRGAYETRNGYIAVNIPDNIQWKRLAETIGRPDLVEDERSKTGTARAKNAQFLSPILEGWFKGRTREEAVQTLIDAGIPCGPVNRAEDVAADPHVKARGSIMEIADPEVGTYGFARTAPHLSAAPNLPAVPAPALGAHTREVLEGVLGYGQAEIAQMVKDKIVEIAR